MPLIGSMFLLAISLCIRLQVNESPAFKKTKEEGRTSKAPLSGAFGNWKNGKIAVTALLGLVAGQAVVWYTGQFYAPFFMQNVIKIDSFTANVMMAWSPILGTVKFTSSCDIAKAQLARISVNYDTAEGAAPGALAVVKVGETAIPSYDAGKLTGDELKQAKATFDSTLNAALKQAGYPLVPAENTTLAKAQNFVDIFTAQKLTIVLILTYLVILVTMVYGPIAAMLVELFPTRIRYSGLSLPHHIGNGWFGGLMPATAFAISAQTGNICSGLCYSFVIAVMTVIIGTLFVPGGTHR